MQEVVHSCPGSTDCKRTVLAGTNYRSFFPSCHSIPYTSNQHNESLGRNLVAPMCKAGQYHAPSSVCLKDATQSMTFAPTFISYVQEKKAKWDFLYFAHFVRLYFILRTCLYIFFKNTNSEDLAGNKFLLKFQLGRSINAHFPLFFFSRDLKLMQRIPVPILEFL